MIDILRIPNDVKILTCDNIIKGITISNIYNTLIFLNLQNANTPSPARITAPEIASPPSLKFKIALKFLFSLLVKINVFKFSNLNL